jgi:hypothetical protein
MSRDRQGMLAPYTESFNVFFSAVPFSHRELAFAGSTRYSWGAEVDDKRDHLYFLLWTSPCPELQQFLFRSFVRFILSVCVILWLNLA